VSLRPFIVVTGLKREARIAAGPGVVTLAGGGAGDLAARIEGAIEKHWPEAVVSFGLAGALAPGLEPGELVVGEAVIVGDEAFACDVEWRARLLVALKLRESGAAWPEGKARATQGEVLGVEAMITTAAKKAALRDQTGAAIVDMESAAAVRAAAAHGLPFAVIRAVSDSADQNLPPAVLNGMKPDGGMDLVGVLASLARDPRQLPALIRTGAEAERGFKALDHARRLLGPRIGRLDLGELLLDVG
jgi:hopanoid-associated phosphorylase